MKWKNIDIGPAYYYITGTFTEWLPLFRREDVRGMVCEEITKTLEEQRAWLSAFVLMPDHLHLLTYLPEQGILHEFCKRWRGRSAIRILATLKAQGDDATLEVMARHANGKAQYAVWKEQPRALAIYSEQKLNAMVNYIHANPLRRRLVENPEDWVLSSYGFYEHGLEMVLPVRPWGL